MDDDDGDEAKEAESRARTHLSNERTFLSWFRTALALLALGLAAAQFLSRPELGVPLVRTIAITLIAASVFTVLAGLRRYAQAARQIEANQFRPSRASVVVMAALLVGLAGLSVAFVLLVRR